MLRFVSPGTGYNGLAESVDIMVGYNGPAQGCGVGVETGRVSKPESESVESYRFG